ncbi:MAG: proton-conducting transporter membrane subunit, partial [Gammaproteobacteria bacterium]
DVVLVAATLHGACTDDMVLYALAWLTASRMVIELLAHTAAPDQARRGAERARTSFRLGDAALVLAVVLVALVSGDSGFASVAAHARPGADLAAPLLIAALALLVAVVVRSASLPAHRWLLASTAAPTPVCALLHAGFVNAGGIAVIKFAPLLAAAPLVRFGLLASGVGAVVGGTAIALVRADVKGRLAGSTMAQMGYMLVQCGLGAHAHALFHILAHGAFKAHAFLRAGSEVSAPGAAALTPPTRGAEWLLLLPCALFFAAWWATDLALADLVLLSFGATLAVEALVLAWGRACLATAALRTAALLVPAALAAGAVHLLLDGGAGGSAPIPHAPSAHLVGAMLGALSVLAFLRAARVELPAPVHGALVRLASTRPPARPAPSGPLVSVLRAARRPN